MPDATVSKSSGAETFRQLAEAKIKAALAKPKAQIATMEGWWNLWVIGPQLLPAPNNPLTPQKMVKVGDTFYVETVVWLNPAGGAASPVNLITNLGQGIDIRYQTGNLNTWSLGPADMNVVHNVPFVPGQGWYYDFLQLTAQPGWEACYEMNVSALVKGANPGALPPLAGFATVTSDIDSDLFYPPAGGPPGVPPRWEYDTPLRFMIYP